MIVLWSVLGALAVGIFMLGLLVCWTVAMDVWHDLGYKRALKKYRQQRKVMEP